MKKNERINFYLILQFLFIFISFSNNLVSDGVTTHNNSFEKYGGTFIEASTADAQTFNPVISSDSSSSKIEDFIFEGLLTFDKDMDFIPNLAQGWEISEDFLDCIFYLREDVYWHDGMRFTAEDVIFTFERVFDPETDTTQTSKFDFFDLENTPFEKIDQYTVIFHNKISITPNIMLNSMNLGIIPHHVFLNSRGEDRTLHTADDCRNNEGVYTFNDDPRNRKPIGTGCMMFSEWKIDDHLTLIRNSIENRGPGYWKEHNSYLDSYILRVISDVNVQLLKLKDGDFDLMDLSSTSQEDIEILMADPNFNVYSAPTFTSDHIAFQCDPSKGSLYGQLERDFDEKPNIFGGFEWQTVENPEITGYLVRQALNYALDKEELIDYEYPQGSRNLGPMYLAQTEWYNENVNPYDYNITKANQLLDQAGFGLTPDDPLRKNINFTITYNQGNLRREKTCEYVVEQWTKLGAIVRIDIREWACFFHYYDDRGFDTMAASWTGGGGDPDLSAVWSSRNILPGGQPIELNPDGTWIWSGLPKEGGLNYMSYWNPTVDLMIDEARVEKYQNIRKIYYDQIQKKIVNDSPYIWLLAQVNMIAVNAEFQGFIENSVAGLWPEPAGFRNIYSISSDSILPSDDDFNNSKINDQTENFGERIISRLSYLPILDIGLIMLIAFELRILVKLVEVTVFRKT